MFCINFHFIFTHINFCLIFFQKIKSGGRDSNPRKIGLQPIAVAAVPPPPTPPTGFEPATPRLEVSCSIQTELQGLTMFTLNH